MGIRGQAGHGRSRRGQVLRGVVCVCVGAGVLPGHRDLRERVDLTATELARLAGWHRTKMSKLEHCVTSPSVEDIRTWCLLYGAPELTEDLIASAKAVSSAYVEWKRRNRAGMKRAQEPYVPLWERTARFRIYVFLLLPGLFQVPGEGQALRTR